MSVCMNASLIFSFHLLMICAEEFELMELSFTGGRFDARCLM